MTKEQLLELHTLVAKESASIQRAQKKLSDIDIVTKELLKNKEELYTSIKNSLLIQFQKLIKNEK